MCGCNAGSGGFFSAAASAVTLIRSRGHHPKAGYDGQNGIRQAGSTVRRQLSDEFRARAVRLVLDEGKTIGAVGRELDLRPSALSLWVRHARADRTKGRTGLTAEERAELASLRKDNRDLRMERDVLKKAAAFFAKHQA